jgi:hypothetical protein
MAAAVLVLAASLVCVACVRHDTVARAARCNVATLGYPGTWGSGAALATFLEGQSGEPVAALGAATLTDDALAPYQILLIQDVRAGVSGQAGPGSGVGRAYSAAEVEALRRWIERGNGVMALGGYTSDSLEPTNVNTLLAPHGLSYGPGAMMFGGGGVTFPVTGWASHPIAAGVDRLGVDDATPIGGSGTPIAWDPATPGTALGRAVESGQGRVFAWGDDWIAYDSQWTGEPTYQVARLWANAFSWLGEPAGCGPAAAGQ